MWIYRGIDNIFEKLFQLQDLCVRANVFIVRYKFQAAILAFLGLCLCCVLSAQRPEYTSLYGVTLVLILYLPFMLSALQSVLKLLILLVAGNIAISYLAARGFIYLVGNMFGLFALCIFFYCALWLLTSILAKSDVVRVANEFIGALFGTIFTVATYALGLLPSDWDLGLPSQAVEQIKQMGITQVQWVMKSLAIFLPFVGVSALSLALTSIKQYWLKKNNRIEAFDAYLSPEN